MFTAREVSRLAGFTKPWMLNHLEREEIFVPEISRAVHHGKHRNYTFRDLVVLRAINRLLELGARPKRVKQAIQSFSAICPDVLGDVNMQGMQLKFAQNSGHFILTPEGVLFAKDHEEIVDLLKNGQLAFSFMVDGSSAIMPSMKAACELRDLGKSSGDRWRLLEQIAVRHAI